MNKHVGSSVESLFEETGELEEVKLRAAKKILVEQLRRWMQLERVTTTQLASRMETSRTVVNRLLDPADTSVTLATMVKATAALGADLVMYLASGPGASRRGRAVEAEPPADRKAPRTKAAAGAKTAASGKPRTRSHRTTAHA